MKTARIVVVVGLVAAVASAFALARRAPQLTEKDRIREAIERARRGVVAHRLSEILAVVSSDYEDGNHTRDTLRALIAYGLRQYPAVQVTLFVTDIQVRGDEADVDTGIKAAARDSGGTPADWEGTLRLRFAREPARRHILFRDHAWRVVRIDGLGDVQDAFAR
ncbi:MAG: hypothetical protein HY321_11890 [Armatimonadetes bacterium]|nr:hypothetical protein [Armatimonadota bacterium]